MPNRFGFPNLGIGLGLRSKHYPTILAEHPAVDWFEIISENFMYTRGRPQWILDQIAERYPIVMHGVSMSIGSRDPLDMDYLAELKKLKQRCRALWLSDHLCWTGVNGRNTHDLLPIPYTEEALKHVCERIRIVQDYLEMPLLLENPSSYLDFTASAMSEYTFLARVCEATNCGLLLDVNNVFVSAFNHGFSARAYLDALPLDHVVQYHVAGHTRHETHIIDTHIGPVIPEVWALFQDVYQRAPAAMLLEWDAEIPDFATVHQEALKAQQWVNFGVSVDEGVAPKRHEQTSSLDLGLLHSQQWLQTVICAPNKVAEGVSIAEKVWTNATAHQVIRSSPHLDATGCLDIYHYAYHARLIECLVDDYPSVQRAVGAGYFESLARDYLHRHHSESRSMNAFGAHFVDYLKCEVADFASRAFVVELAELEWAMVCAIHAEEVPSFDATSLASMDPAAWANLILQPRPSLSVHCFQYPVNAYLQAVHAENTSAPHVVHAVELPAPSATVTAVFRRDWRVSRMDLTPVAHTLLQILMNGIPLGDALSAVEDVAELSDVSRWFQDWVACGFFSNFHASVS